jgi:hypothetical protein
LAYYANAFDAVLVPAEQLAGTTRAEAETWAADAPPPFLFYLEVAGDHGSGSSPEPPPEALAALAGRIGALILAGGPGSAAPGWLPRLRGIPPLVRLEAESAGPGALAWRPGRVPSLGERPGCFGWMPGAEQGPRALRDSLVAFQTWAVGCDRAMLCFPATPVAWREMETARTIVDLLGG